MAEKTEETQTPQLPSFSAKDVKKASAWFKKAEAEREKRSYDYAIECYITGLEFWPEAVEEGHKPLYSLAIQRLQVGGKKPGMMEGLKKSMTGKDAKKAMLNAEALLAKDPRNGNYLDGVLKNAAKGGFLRTLEWIMPLAFDSMKAEKKPSAGRFKNYRQTLVEAGETAVAAGEGQLAAQFFEAAVNSIDYQLARNPGDEVLKNEQRNISGKLTIARGKYSDSESFRDSIQDAESQKRIHDTERVKQGDQTLEALVESARREYETEPESSHKLSNLVDLLLRRERKPEEDEAVRLLKESYERTKNYALKSRADDIRLKQLQRDARALVAAAKESGSDDDKQQARLATNELLEQEIEVYRERVKQYPTDLRLKFRLGRALFNARQYEEAIPALQAAQGDPRSRAVCQLLIGRSFYENGAHSQAREVLKDAIGELEEADGDARKELLYWLARAHEANAEAEAAKDAYGKVLRLDYGYSDARRRLDALQADGAADS